MNNDELLADLKDFITTTVGQTEARLTSRMDQFDSRMDRLDGRMDGLDSRMDRMESRMDRLETTVTDGFRTIGESLDQLHDQVADHERRISRLEDQAA